MYNFSNAKELKITECWEYESIRATEEHAYGETIRLWQLSDGRTQGVLVSQCGAMGSPDRTYFRKIEIDKSGKNLKYSTKEHDFSFSKVGNKITGKFNYKVGSSCEKGSQLSVQLLKLDDCSSHEYEKDSYNNL